MSISLCACMGTMYDEPHCYCEMKRLGLKLNEQAREIERKRCEEDLQKLFGVGGEYYRQSTDNAAQKE